MMSYRHDMQEERDRHLARAEAHLKDSASAESRDAVLMLARAQAHATLALYYQREAE